MSGSLALSGVILGLGLARAPAQWRDIGLFWTMVALGGSIAIRWMTTRATVRVAAWIAACVGSVSAVIDLSTSDPVHLAATVYAWMLAIILALTRVIRRNPSPLLAQHVELPPEPEGQAIAELAWPDPRFLEQIAVFYGYFPGFRLVALIAALGLLEAVTGRGIWSLTGLAALALALVIMAGPLLRARGFRAASRRRAIRMPTSAAAMPDRLRFMDGADRVDVAWRQLGPLIVTPWSIGITAGGALMAIIPRRRVSAGADVATFILALRENISVEHAEAQRPVLGLPAALIVVGVAVVYWVVMVAFGGPNLPAVR